MRRYYYKSSWLVEVASSTDTKTDTKWVKMSVSEWFQIMIG